MDIAFEMKIQSSDIYLIDRRGDLKTLVNDSALPLEANIFGPLDKTTQVLSSGADVSSDSSRSGPGREEGVSLLGRC